MTVDHVPDSEDERKRIEFQNPNPNMPLVRYVGGTWRVGGLLALSRAFGDAYMKGTGQFEGVQAGSDNYSSGFGVVAEPDITNKLLTKDDAWIVVASDGLFENEVRGGGGGLSNEEVRVGRWLVVGGRSIDNSSVRSLDAFDAFRSAGYQALREAQQEVLQGDCRDPD